jgi:hypothetical protein
MIILKLAVVTVENSLQIIRINKMTKANYACSGLKEPLVQVINIIALVLALP